MKNTWSACARVCAVLILFMVALTTFSGCTKKEDTKLVVYGPESMSFMNDTLIPWLKDTKGIEVEFVPVNGLVSMLELEKNNPKADIVMGLTAINATQAKEKGFLAPYKPKGTDRLQSEDFVMDPEWYVSAFDYGALAVNYNTTTLATPPRSFEDMIAMGGRSLIVEDPRSLTGQEVMLWSYALYGDKWEEFWTRMKPAVLAVAPGWSEAFAKLQAGEAPMMMGFATSDLYFTDGKFDSFIPEEGGYIYLEGAALVAKKHIKSAAKSFMDALWDPEFQKTMLEQNYMLPVTAYKLPAEYAGVPFADRIVRLPMGLSSEKVEEMKTRFIEIMQE